MVDDQQYWNIYLDTIRYVINNTYHTALRASSSKVLDIEQCNNADIELVDCLNKIAKTEFDFQWTGIPVASGLRSHQQN